MAKKPKIPADMRRLTKAESEKLGVKYSAKRYVRADLKRVTKKTVTYSERQHYKAKYGVTREEHSLQRRTETFAAGGQDKKGSKHVKDLRKREFAKQVKAAKGRKVQLQALGNPSRSGARYQQGGPVWVTGPLVDADELNDPEFLERVLENMGFDMEPDEETGQPENGPAKFGLIVYEGDQTERARGSFRRVDKTGRSK